LIIIPQILRSVTIDRKTGKEKSREYIEVTEEEKEQYDEWLAKTQAEIIFNSESFQNYIKECQEKNTNNT
jgi:RNA-splicing ligase RtcB